MTDAQRQQLTTLFSQHPTAVIATADTSGNPAAAVVLFAEESYLSVIFGTHPTRKYQNLKSNPLAAFVFHKDWWQIQAHGSVVELSGADARAAGQLFGQKHPEMDQHLMAGSVFFRFTPTWIRYMNTGAKPPEQWEVTF